MARPKIINEKNLTEAIKDSFGHQMTIAKRLHVTYQTVYNAFKEFPHLKPLLDEERNKLLDVAEWVVSQAIINKKDVKVAMWVLEKLGAKRGFNPELELKDNKMNVQAHVTFLDNMPKDDEEQ